MAMLAASTAVVLASARTTLAKWISTVSTPSLRAQRSNPESFRGGILDCFVATLLAMTAGVMVGL